MKRTLLAGVAGLAVLAAGSVQAQDLVFPVGEGDFSWESYNEWAESAPDLSGQTVTIAGPWLQPEDEVFRSAIAYFAAATGAEAIYTGSDSFEQQIVIDAEAGSAPNVAVFPQPGLAADMASRGLLSPLPEGMGEWVAENYGAGESWVDLGTYPDQDGNDQLFGFFYNVNVKSLVWYVPENFEDAGYEVPESMEELKALTEQIAADGETPWCIGLGSGAATGWPATDWVEDIMLRTQPPEVYDGWTTNEIPFNDERVVAAIEEFGWFARNDDFVSGGAGQVASTDFRDSPKGLFASPPQCYMHRQASFVPAFFPEGIEFGEDVDFFYFPAFAEKDLGNPVLGGGTLMSITDPSEATNHLMEFFKLPIAHEIMMAQTGFLTPHKGVNADTYMNDALKGQGEILVNATTFRFDGSDLMPGGVGAGSFWTGMVDYTGGKDAQAVADEIQASWEALK
ncbi:MAG: carbohydrate ABC transporter substrate-binding protein [Roseitalea sp.]|uniref:Carbohydrate ABC transporter substrate-binding protein n=1 Tax=Oceaniradius stylonematis TaxID=2184161 RepID=A0A3A8APV0_9HYPH|nr:ABC transporter substrate-binding protein [Oceaniradius stylonematis]MBO6553370.1 carbohydrate ABC transporter substrate-binding protein [Roseitalea sp.]MBO6952413.1 carbohydrate ABC transporter substrate-binding protein [Rhizobiaceae bacterium]RNC91527.1 MAG: carbohydrate ABC transporter substrate-binding protein [Oricola sp.]MBO6593101.1 carbohydrate ABC transporter substrate-binding protein [Roseitalea sp.]MBO6600157.1 carbohydrate ABC transporter substrate-binding protein [Roseitalea sp